MGWIMTAWAGTSLKYTSWQNNNMDQDAGGYELIRYITCTLIH